MMYMLLLKSHMFILLLLFKLNVATCIDTLPADDNFCLVADECTVKFSKYLHEYYSNFWYY